MMRLFVSFLLFACFAQAEEKTEPAPPVKDLGNGRFQIGEITFDQKTRHISFPTAINMTEGLLEFAIVHEKGKVHESLLLTTASALHLNIALKLLHYQESPELFPILNKDFENTGKFPDVAEATKTAARLRVDLTWKHDGKEGKASLNDWIYHLPTEKAMEPTPWLYSGSYIHDGKFNAQSSGDYFAIFISRGALINFPGKDNDLDEVWIPTPNVIPPQGTIVTVTLSPLLNTTKN